jgi:hypothetical protein
VALNTITLTPINTVCTFEDPDRAPPAGVNMLFTAYAIASSFQIGPAKTQVGLLKFSTTVNGEFMLNQYSTSGAIKTIDSCAKFQ